ncbi:DNA mismatch repair endonuclease MutL [Candidatus Peribacteria bacterium]|nr:DNA mismatch repair endonuclease MutL [Candidatus Peribacteria bacterium]
MSIIHRLPQSVADQIAAGEVVERPASIVKELIENSLDAGATQVAITLERGGKQRLSVHDNGQGMSQEDLPRSIERHATSKIRRIEDLFRVQSFGFRGEALAAVASVSSLTITSRQAADSTAHQLRVRHGAPSPVTPTAANPGTTVLVEELFASVPARLQYLRTDSTERSHIYATVQALALQHVGVGFRVESEGKTVLDYPPGDELSRLQAILGESAGQLIPVEYHAQTLRIEGYTAHPQQLSNHKRHQYLYVNGRPVEDWRLAHAVREAYAQSSGIPKGSQPWWVLRLQLDPILVDINVHPRKTEVKFAEPSEIYHHVQRAVRAAIATISGQRAPGMPAPDPLARLSSRSGNTPQQPLVPGLAVSFAERFAARDRGPLPSTTPSTPPAATLPPSQELRYLGQAGRKFLLAESDTGLYLFDQHALHERQRFEQLYRELREGTFSVQGLLSPVIVPLSLAEAEALQEHAGVFSQMGIVAEIGQQEVTIEALPTLLAGSDSAQMVHDILGYITQHGTTELPLERVLRVLLEYKSCRGAVKFGDALSPTEAEYLLQQLDNTVWALLCPHGRPNYQYWSWEELERLSGR